ncbi:MAG: sugar phosphate isomerase/epimerase [Promethearchaeota archaeon]|nr:MAG: sugar phosphate isomerase/epimerase [Candidatus Lokiarchaeota archaeon]
MSLAKIAKIGLATYSFRHELKKGTLSLKEIFRVLKHLEMYGLGLHHSHFEDKNLPSIVEEAKSYDLTIYGLGPSGDLIATADKQEKIINNYKRYIDLAGDNGIPYVRAFMMGHVYLLNRLIGRKKQFQMAVETIRPLVKSAEERNVSLSIESHWKFSSDIPFMKQILDQFPSKALGWLYDFGNYYSEEDRWAALDLIKEKRLNYVHAKIYAFNKIGFESKLDYMKLVKELKKADYAGIYSIEFEGKLPDMEGVAKSYELLKHCMYKDAHHLNPNPNIKTLWEIAKKNQE